MNVSGKIIKGIAGFYYVYEQGEETTIYECKAKGIFRNRNKKPLVGDNVVVEILGDGKGNIIEILPRENELIRPAAANINQAVVIFAADNPAPNLNLLDRFLIAMEKQNLETYVCFNKKDIVSEETLYSLGEHYKKAGYPVMYISTYTKDGIGALEHLLHGKTTMFAGPSGVGKSSLINIICPKANMETGEISEKIKRGKHTTRHSELFLIGDNTFLMDTPGFSSLYIEGIEKEELKDYFREFAPFEESCRFIGCQHLNEPDCGVKEAMEEGKITQNRYNNYKLIYEELKQQKKY